jgi:hypothetical protein
MDNLPNNAPIDNTGRETNPPVNNNPGNGGTTFPSLSSGLVANTIISLTNADLAHVCDFSLDIEKNTQLKQFIISQNQNIKDAKRAIMLALGYSDATGSYQWLIDDLKAITRALKYIQKHVIQPILDFENLVIGYLQKLKAIIAYILSLPARFLKLLQSCLSNLYKAIANVFSDITSGTGATSSGLSDVIAAAKETATALQSTVQQTALAAGQAVAIAGAASTVVPSIGTANKRLP